HAELFADPEGPKMIVTPNEANGHQLIWISSDLEGNRTQQVLLEVPSHHHLYLAQDVALAGGDRILLFNRGDHFICTPASWCVPLNDFELFRVSPEGSVRWHRRGDGNFGMVHLDVTGSMWWLRYE